MNEIFYFDNILIHVVSGKLSLRFHGLPLSTKKISTKEKKRKNDSISANKDFSHILLCTLIAYFIKNQT